MTYKDGPRTERVNISIRKTGALVQWLKLLAWQVGDRGFVPSSGIQVPENLKFPHRSFVKIQYCREPP